MRMTSRGRGRPWLEQVGRWHGRTEPAGTKYNSKNNNNNDNDNNNNNNNIIITTIVITNCNNNYDYCVLL